MGAIKDRKLIFWVLFLSLSLSTEAFKFLKTGQGNKHKKITTTTEETSPDYTQSCETVMDDVWEEKCKTIYSDQCETTYSQVCKPSKTVECSTISEEKCSLAFQEVCKDINIPYCNIVMEDTCSLEDECTPTTETVCSQVPKKVCKEVPISEITTIETIEDDPLTYPAPILTPPAPILPPTYGENKPEDSTTTTSDPEQPSTFYQVPASRPSLVEGKSSTEIGEEYEVPLESDESVEIENREEHPVYKRSVHHLEKVLNKLDYKADKHNSKIDFKKAIVNSLIAKKEYKKSKKNKSTSQNTNVQTPIKPTVICTETTVESCYDQTSQSCVKVNKCSKFPKKTCGFYAKQTCANLPTKKCVKVPKEVCVDKIDQICENVPKEVCVPFPKKSCKKIVVPRPREVCYPNKLY